MVLRHSRMEEPSADELIHITRAKSDIFEMVSAKLDLGEYIFVSQMLSVRINVVHDAVYLEKCDHLVDIVGHNKRMRLTGWFKYIRPLRRNPFVLEIMPTPPQDETVYSIGMPVPGQNARTRHFQQVHPVTLRSVQA